MTKTAELELSSGVYWCAGPCAPDQGTPVELLCAGAGNVISDVLSALYTTTESKPIWTPGTAPGLCDPKVG
jgi:hypothetical protein